MLLPSDTIEICIGSEKLPVIEALQTHEEDPFGQEALGWWQVLKQRVHLGTIDMNNQKSTSIGCREQKVNIGRLLGA